MASTGPSIRAVCRILNQSSCGSGSICGMRNGKSLILTNAHVAGTRIGRRVQVDVESQNERIEAVVIMAAYSDRTLADWAVLETSEPYDKVQPVHLSKRRPTGSHYTKGFPRCQAFFGSDISTVDLSNNSPLWKWNPNSIGGQSGSGVWSDVDNLQYGLLTWSWGGFGAGQMTSEIYRQARSRSLVGHPRPEGLIEVSPAGDFDFDGVNKSGVNDDPIVENGFFQQTDITTLPIWEGSSPIPPGNEDPSSVRSMLIEWHRKQSEAHQDQVDLLEGIDPAPGGGTDDGSADGTFGL